jgi:hypothetical protein
VILQGQTGAETRAPIGESGLVSVGLKSLGMVKDRVFVRISGLSRCVDIIPFSHTFSNLKRAVAERVFYVKRDGEFRRPPRPENFEQTLSGVRSTIRKFLPKTTPWSVPEFLASCKGRKKKVYERAAESLVREPLCGKDSDVEVFIKYEKTDCTSKADPVPRVISPRSPRYNIMLGRYLKKLEHLMFKSIGKLYGSPTVIKGYNAYESARILRNKWDQFSHPVAIGLDASRFDQHVSLDALRWEHGVYLECFPIKKHQNELRSLLEKQLYNQCVGYAPDGTLRYTTQGTRMSGDMNTSLGNCLLMCSMIHEYARQRNVTVHLANNGDDCVVILDSKDLAQFSQGLDEWFTNVGFTMKVEKPVYIFEQIEFCQTHPVFDGQRWLMMRNPLTAIEKDTVLLQPYQSKKQILNWLAAVGQGGLRLTGGLPVSQNFYRAYMKYGKPGQISVEYQSWFVRKLSEGMDRDFGPVTPEARLSFYNAFGITPSEQIELEGYFDQWVFNPVVVKGDHESFHHRVFPM